MKTYNVKTPISHGVLDKEGKKVVEDYLPGDEIELDDETAEPLLAVAAIEDPATAKKDKPARPPKKVKK